MAATKQDRASVFHQATREIRWLANSLKGMLAVADELHDLATLEKERDAFRAEIDALKVERKNYTDLTAEVAAAKSELARVRAEIDTVKARFA
jgi:hypothetical protein